MPVDIASVTGAVVIGIILIGVVGNVLTLFVIMRYDPLRDVTGMFLANLAAADLLQSTFGMPLIATSAFHEEWIFGDALCTISGITNSLFCITSVLTLTAISVDRYLAIVHPFEYQVWLTVRRARLVLVCIWLQALFAAILPVFGWSRYVYLPYEFICTVQWEYDKAYTIFVWFICFVAPLIVTVVCYSRVMKVACRQAREEPPIAVGRFSVSEQIPDAGQEPGADGKLTKKAKQNLAFIADDLPQISLTENDTFEAVSLPRDNIDQTRDPSPRGDVPEKSIASVNLRPSGMLGIFRRNPVVVPAILNTATASKQDAAACNDCMSSSASRSGALAIAIIQSPASVVVLPENPKTSTQSGKYAASHGHSSRTDAGPSGKVGKSRVSPLVAGSPILNSWTKVNPRQRELVVIPEEDGEVDYPARSSKLPGYLARVRGRMSKRGIGARQQRRKEMKVALILLVVNGTFVLCWLPHFIGILCLMFTNGSCPFPDSFFIVTTTLAMLNSGCNPFIYTLTYRKFRKAFKRVLPCFRSNCSRNMDRPSD